MTRIGEAIETLNRARHQSCDSWRLIERDTGTALTAAPIYGVMAGPICGVTYHLTEFEALAVAEQYERIAAERKANGYFPLYQ